MRPRHAIRNRDFCSWGLAALLVCGVQVAHAGYASVQPPTAVQGGPGAYRIQKTADIAIKKAASSANAYMKGVGRIPGLKTPIPFMARVAAGAPAAAARFMFGGPVGLGVAAVAFLASEYITYEDGTFVYTDPNAVTYPKSDGFVYCLWRHPTIPCHVEPQLTFEAAVQKVRETLAGQGRELGAYGQTSAGMWWYEERYFGRLLATWTNLPTGYTVSSCPSGWYVTDQGCVQNSPGAAQPLTEEQFVEKVAPKISPEKIPELVPTMPIPVGDPMVLPDNDADEDSATPRPYYIPQGEPQAVPDTNPQQYTQPMTRVVPSPTASDPWRVDLQPVERTSTDPTSVSEPTQNPNGPSTGTTAPKTDADLCEKHPDIDACRETEYDTPDGEIPRDSINITYAPESFLGGGAGCPAPTDIHFMGHTARVLDTSTACGWVSTYMRPVLLALCAWLSLSIVMGGLGSRE